MYILGQVLRSFPGAIKQELKTKIARECYLLGLRVLSVVFHMVQTHTDELRSYFAAVIKEQRAVVRTWELPSNAEEVILNMVHGWSFGMIKRISDSVGLAELDATYEQVMNDTGNLLSVHFVDLSIRLDHQFGFPEEQVNKLHQRTRKSLFSHSVLRDLLVHHFVLFHSTSAIRQKYCKLLEIKEAGRPLLEERLPKLQDS